MNIKRARHLRRASSRVAKLVWTWLRDRRFHGWKFRREHPIGPYSLDFYCAEARLAIELDGFQHYAPEARCHDEKRDAFLRAKGIETLRYSNVRFWREPEIIKGCHLSKIAAARSEATTAPYVWDSDADSERPKGADPHPGPLPKGEGSFVRSAFPQSGPSPSGRRAKVRGATRNFLTFASFRLCC